MNEIFNSSNKPLMVVLGVFAAMVFLLSVSITWYGDALAYTFSWADGSRIRGLGGLFSAIAAADHALPYGITPNVFSHIFTLYLGKFLFSLCNAFVYVAMCVTMIRVSGGSRRSIHCETTMAIMLFVLFDYSYNVTTQISTVWVAALSIYAIRLFNKVKYYDVEVPLWQMPLLGLFALIAGCGNPSITYPLAVAFAIYAVRKRDVLRPAQVVMLVGFFLGVLLLFKTTPLKRQSDIVITAMNLIKYSRVTYILIIVWIYAKTQRYKNMDKFYKHHAFMANGFFASIAIAVYMGISSPADLMGIEVFAASLTLTMMKNKAFTMPFIIAGSAAVIVMFFVKMVMIYQHDKAYNSLRDQIATTTTGRVYVDLPAPSLYLHPADGPTYTDPDKLQWHISTILDYLGGESLSKQRRLRLTDKEYAKDIVVIPAVIKEIVQGPVKNQIVKCPGDVYLLLQSKEHPLEFVIKRDYGVFTLIIDHTEETVEFDDPRYSTRDYNVVVSSFLNPLTINREVSIFE